MTNEIVITPFIEKIVLENSRTAGEEMRQALEPTGMQFIGYSYRPAQNRNGQRFTAYLVEFRHDQNYIMQIYLLNQKLELCYLDETESPSVDGFTAIKTKAIQLLNNIMSQG